VQSSQLTTLQASSAGSSTLTTLGQGLSRYVIRKLKLNFTYKDTMCCSYDYVVNCVVIANDIWGDSAMSNRSVVVNPIPLSNLKSIVNNQVALAFKTHDANSVMNLVSAASSALNAVDCSLAGDCIAKYNRAQCAYVTNTCGACISGFVGEDGDSNSMCFASSVASPKRIFSQTNEDALYPVSINSIFDSRRTLLASKNVFGSPCSSNRDCYSSICTRGLCAAGI